MPVKINISKISAADAALLSATALKAYNDHYLHLWYDNGEWYKQKSFTESVLKEEVLDSNNLFFIAYADDEPVGFLKLRMDAVLETDLNKDAMELERIYLTKAASGKGIGKALVDLSVAVANDHNKQLIWLKAMDTSTGPIAFYEKMGFEICGTHHLNFERMKEELRGMVIMKKDLR